MANGEKMCGSCKQGEIEDSPAVYLATGHDGQRPFRILLCHEHADMYLTDYGEENCKLKKL